MIYSLYRRLSWVEQRSQSHPGLSPSSLHNFSLTFTLCQGQKKKNIGENIWIFAPKHVDSLLQVWHRRELSEGPLGQAGSTQGNGGREKGQGAGSSATAASQERRAALWDHPLPSGHSGTTKAFLCSVEKPLKWRLRGGASLSDVHLHQLWNTMSLLRRLAGTQTIPEFTVFTRE